MAGSTLHCSLCSRHWFRESIGRNPILQVYQSDLGLGLPVFVVAVIVNVAVFCCVVNIVISILNRECAESTLVRDFATFHIFFDFSHTPDQVLTPDTPGQIPRQGQTAKQTDYPRQPNQPDKAKQPNPETQARHTHQVTWPNPPRPNSQGGTNQSSN